METQLYISNVVSLEYNPARCTGCKMCVIVCPHGVFSMVNKKAQIIHLDKCMECGACMLNCKDDAISVNKGVGCATAVLNSKLRKTDISCGCDNSCTC